MADHVSATLPRLADALLEVGTRLGEIGAELHALHQAPPTSVPDWAATRTGHEAPPTIASSTTPHGDRPGTTPPSAEGAAMEPGGTTSPGNPPGAAPPGARGAASEPGETTPLGDRPDTTPTGAPASAPGPASPRAQGTVPD